MRERTKESGFTLLEIALVILIAGLLIGAVLNSRGISDAAKSLRLQKQVEELNVVVDLYLNRMTHLPGDGNTGDTWTEDLLAEELITSENSANTHAFGDSVTFVDGQAPGNTPFTNPENVFQYDNIPAKWARTLIATFEDPANPHQGNIRATTTVDVTTALTQGNLDTEVTSGNSVHVFVRN